MWNLPVNVNLPVNMNLHLTYGQNLISRYKKVIESVCVNCRSIRSHSNPTHKKCRSIWTCRSTWTHSKPMDKILLPATQKVNGILCVMRTSGLFRDLKNYKPNLPRKKLAIVICHWFVHKISRTNVTYVVTVYRPRAAYVNFDTVFYLQTTMLASFVYAECSCWWLIALKQKFIWNIWNI